MSGAFRGERLCERIEALSLQQYDHIASVDATYIPCHEMFAIYSRY